MSHIILLLCNVTAATVRLAVAGCSGRRTAAMLCRGRPPRTAHDWHPRCVVGGAAGTVPCLWRRGTGWRLASGRPRPSAAGSDSRLRRRRTGPPRHSKQPRLPVVSVTACFVPVMHAWWHADTSSVAHDARGVTIAYRASPARPVTGARAPCTTVTPAV
jgi:hypothetical protein